MAADAASSPDPTTSRRASTPPQARPEAAPTDAARSGVRMGDKAARTTRQVLQTKEGIVRGGRHFGQAAWGPFVRLSGVLWLELMGVFFGLFVMTATINVWKLHANLHETAFNHFEHRHLQWSIAMAVMFGYFSVSSFVRARRRERRGR